MFIFAILAVANLANYNECFFLVDCVAICMYLYVVRQLMNETSGYQYQSGKLSEPMSHEYVWKSLNYNTLDQTYIIQSVSEKYARDCDYSLATHPDSLSKLWWLCKWTSVCTLVPWLSIHFWMLSCNACFVFC